MRKKLAKHPFFRKYPPPPFGPAKDGDKWGPILPDKSIVCVHYDFDNYHHRFRAFDDALEWTWTRLSKEVNENTAIGCYFMDSGTRKYLPRQKYKGMFEKSGDVHLQVYGDCDYGPVADIMFESKSGIGEYRYIYGLGWHHTFATMMKVKNHFGKKEKITPPFFESALNEVF